MTHLIMQILTVIMLISAPVAYRLSFASFLFLVQHFLDQPCSFLPDFRLHLLIFRPVEEQDPVDEGFLRLGIN